MSEATSRVGSVVLMARIVDADGKCVRSSDVEAIDYSIYELDSNRPGSAKVLGGLGGAAVDIRDVIHDSPRTDARWTLDDEGYNFRHELDLGSAEAFPRTGMNYQVIYEFTRTTGGKAMLRFHLAAVSEIR